MKADLAVPLGPALVLFLSLSASAQTSPPVPPPGTAAAPGAPTARPKPPLLDLAFLAGSWMDSGPDHVSEENWTVPSGDSMEGMWRYLAGGKVQTYALVTIRDEEGGPVLRVRHFDAELAPREEKALALKLVEKGDRYARFEGPSRGVAGTVTLAYKRDGDTLVARLTKDGGSEEFRFRMKRWGGAPASDRFRRRGWSENPSR